MPSACWSVPALAEEIAGVRHALVGFARDHGIPEQRLGDLRLAISEAVTNAVLHAFRTRDRPGTITVSILVRPGEERAEVTVRDDGIGMSPRNDSPGLGLGLALISRMADETAFRRPAEGDGFELWMGFGFATDSGPS